MHETPEEIPGENGLLRAAANVAEEPPIEDEPQDCLPDSIFGKRSWADDTEADGRGSVSSLKKAQGLRLDGRTTKLGSLDAAADNPNDSSRQNLGGDSAGLGYA